MIYKKNMYITRALMGRNPCLDQAIQTRKFKVFKVTRNFNTESCYFIKQLLYDLYFGGGGGGGVTPIPPSSFAPG